MQSDINGVFVGDTLASADGKAVKVTGLDLTAGLVVLENLSGETGVADLAGLLEAIKTGSIVIILESDLEGEEEETD